jgi:hypothetical protein
MSPRKDKHQAKKSERNNHSLAGKTQCIAAGGGGICMVSLVFPSAQKCFRLVIQGKCRTVMFAA